MLYAVLGYFVVMEVVGRVWPKVTGPSQADLDELAEELHDIEVRVDSLEIWESMQKRKQFGGREP
jgi:hypothetical protein